jgi:hypothetical protein
MSLEHAYHGFAALEFTDEEVARVLARAEARPARRQRGMALAAFAAAVALVVSASIAGAGFGDAIDRFFAGGRPPGTPFAGGRGELPPWLRDGDARVVAASGDERLFAYRAPSGDVCFDFGGHVGLCTPYDRTSLFGDEPVALFGPTHRDANRRWVLWGVALDHVARVELHYTEGPPTAVASTNGFVLRADGERAPSSLRALDASGRQLTEIDVRRRFELAPVGG